MGDGVACVNASSQWWTLSFRTEPQLSVQTIAQRKDGHVTKMSVAHLPRRWQGPRTEAVPCGVPGAQKAAQRLPVLDSLPFEVLRFSDVKFDTYSTGSS